MVDDFIHYREHFYKQARVHIHKLRSHNVNCEKNHFYIFVVLLKI